MTTIETRTYEEPEPDTQLNNASRMLVLLSILDDNIIDYDIIGIATWSNTVYDCMVQIELDNNLYCME